MNVKPEIATTIAKDVYNRDGTLWLKKGSNIALCSSFDTKKFGKFDIITPNPVHLFMDNVNYLINEMEKLEKTINQSNKIIVFSKLVDGVNKYSTDELLKLDPEAKSVRKLDNNSLYKYFNLSLNCLMSLVLTVEAFVNKELPTKHTTMKTDKSGNSKILDKEGIEVGFRLDEKIEELGKALGISGYKEEKFWQEFKKVKRLRDDLVHLKTKGSEQGNRNDALFAEIFETNFKKSRSSFIDLINFFIKDYIQE